MAKLAKGQKSIITYTPGRLHRVKLRGKRQAKGLISLYLDYYLGSTIDKAGKAKAQRQFEFLGIYIKDNPQTTQERETNKSRLDLAYSIRNKREDFLISSNEGLLSPHRKKINFIDYFQNYADNYQNKDIRLVTCCLTHFKKFVGKDFVSLNEVNEGFVNGFKRYLQENLNGETPNNYFTKFKQLCKIATQERLFNLNPSENITIKRPGGVKKEILSFKEIDQLVKTDCGNFEIKQAFLFCLNTGLRFVDVKGLQWKHIDIEAGQIRKSQTKVKNSSNPFVYIDLNNNAKAILSKQEKGNPTDLVFTLPTFEACLKSLKHWTKKAGIEKNITWHSARHSFATNLLMNNANIKTVSSLLGHSGLKHTEKYIHLVDELKKKAVDSLPDYNLKNS